MKLETWTIQGSAGFHFGRHGIGQEESTAIFPSDSLFAALVYQLALIRPQPEVRDWCQQFETDPPFLLTCAFPSAGQVRFYPLPMHIHSKVADVWQDSKALKRTSLISEDILQAIMRGDETKLFNAITIQGGAALISPGEFGLLDPSVQTDKRLWEINKRPRVTVGRQVAQSNLYHTGITTFSPGCGLWFGIQWRIESSEEKALVRQLLQILGDSGLGGERSAGFGSAKIEPGPSLDLPDSGQGLAYLLSRYIPKAGEWAALQHPSARYKVVDTGGWAYTSQHRSQRRKTVTQIEAGSVLFGLDRQPAGCLVDVRPTYEGVPDFPHPIWRSGYAVVIGL